MHLFNKTHHHEHDISTDEEHDDNIDPELRLRTVRTAASAIAESILSEQRAERRKTMRKKRSRFFRRHHEKKAASLASADSSPSKEIPGARRNVYVNHSLSPIEVASDGEPKARYVRNKVRTTSAFFECCGVVFDTDLACRIYPIDFYSEKFVRTVSTVRVLSLILALVLNLA
jgi:phospholipid-translocating ATPase